MLHQRPFALFSAKCWKPRRTASRPVAFSLIELLIVVAIIGILTAVSAPLISGLHESANDSRDRSNAQNIATVSAAVAALGVIHVFPESLGGKEASVRLLREGVTVTSGPFAGQRFMIKALTDEEIRQAVQYLEVMSEGGELRLAYIPGSL